MRRIGTLTVLLILVIGTGDLLAQGRGPGRFAGGFPEGPAPAPKALLQLEGTVEQVNLVAGRGNPSILVGGETVVLAPLFHLESLDFTVEPGDWIRAEVFESPGRARHMIAVKVLNVTRNRTAELRDGSGQPLWTTARWGTRGRIGRGPCGGLIRDVEAAETWTDTVREVAGEPGPRYPRVTLDGGRVIAAGAYRAWMDRDFGLSAGDDVEVTAYPCATGADRWVAMEITNLRTGERLRLRDQSGFPLQTPRGRGGRGFGLQ